MQSQALPPRKEITASQAALMLRVEPARVRQLLFEGRIHKAGYKEINGKVHVMVYQDEIENRVPAYPRRKPTPKRW